MKLRLRLLTAALMGASILAALASAVPSVASNTPAHCLRGTATGDGDTLTLSAPIEGTTAVRLAGVVAPLSPEQVPSGSMPLASRATRDALAALIAERCLSLVPDLPIVDRYNRMYAHVYRDDGVWVQGELVRDGLLVVLPGMDEPDRIRQLLPLEMAARAARRGIWATNQYAIRAPEQAARYVGTLQLVEGVVRKSTRAGSQIYLNFGEDWRTDFTVVIPVSALKTWERAGVYPLHLAGRRIRTRGFIEMLNGPMIEVQQPEMIELLSSHD
jgi:Micrococcal nuclease (thermonuclease) homologs